MRKIIILFAAICLSLIGFGQTPKTDSIYSIPMVYFNYTLQFSGGDLVDRYGVSSGVGGGFQWKTNKNWVFGFEYNYIFGGDIKIEDQLMANIKTHNGQIIDNGGAFANYTTSERGFYTSFKFGKLIPVSKSNRNSGILIMGSVGYLQHRIRIENIDNIAPQIEGDYQYGYDRLTGGFSVSEFIGYFYIGDSRLLNFYAGFEFIQGFTSPKRKVNFDTQQPDPIQNRMDMLNGIKLSWIIPIGKRGTANDVYYY